MGSIDYKIAWRNVWRNPRRTILTVSAVAFACILLVFMLSMQFGSYETMINSSVKMSTGHLQIQVKGYHENQNMRLTIDQPQKIARMLDNLDLVSAYTFRSMGYSLISSEKRTYGAVVVGIDPEKEQKVSTIKQLVRSGAFLSPDDTYQALIGSLLAKNLDVSIGDDITLLGQGKDGSVAATVVKIKGIFSSGIDEFDRSFINIPIKVFNSVYSMDNSVHEAVILSRSLSDVGPLKQMIETRLKALNLSDRLTVLDWKQLTPGLMQSIELDLSMGIIMYVILILVVAFSIMNTFLMAILERTREFGILMAIGTTPGRLTRLLLIESFCMTMVGVIIGTILGALVTLYFQINGIDMSGSSDMLRQYGISGLIYPQLSWLTALIGPVLVLIITFPVALYPALKVTRLNPVKAIASN